MATANDTTQDGPALAMTVLYEANDLLNVLREHHGETFTTGKEASGRLAAQWTLIGEISRRLNSAIAHLDGAVPRPAEANDGEAGKAGSDDDAENPGYDLLMDIQIQVGELKGVADVAVEVCGAAADDVLSVIARRAAAIVDQMNDLIPFVKGGAA